MAEKLVWIDGEIRPASEFRLDPEDEGLLYGRGVFTTTRTFGGKPWLWNLHQKRLLRSASVIGVPLDIASLPTMHDVSRFVQAVAAGDLVVRCNVAASNVPSGRRIWMFARLVPETREPLKLTISARRFAPEDPLASVKSFNYLSRHLVFRDAIERGFDDAVLISTDEHVLETAHSNLFARFDSEWFTPRLTDGVLAGTVRETLLEVKSAHGSPMSEVNVDIGELLAADEVVVTNSVHGVVPVRQIDRKTFETTEATVQLQQIVKQTQI